MTYHLFENEKTHDDSPALIEWKGAGAISLVFSCRVDRTIVCIEPVESIGRNCEHSESRGELTGQNARTE
jgi:hypothetical protein